MNFLSKAQTTVKATADNVTGKTALEQEKAAHEETKADLKAVTLELENTKAALEEAELELSKERQARMDLQDTLDSIEAEAAAAAAEEEDAAAAQAAAEAELQAQSEEMRAKALEAANLAYEAMSGLTTSDNKLADALGPLNNEELQVLKQTYMSTYGQDLVGRVKKNTSGNFRSFLLGLLDTVPAYQAKAVRNAIGQLSTDNDVLIETLCPLDNMEMAVLKDAFAEIYAPRDLVDVVTKGTSGDLNKYLTIVVQGARESGDADDAAVQADAQALYNAGQGKTIGVDKTPFFTIIGNRSPAHLAALNEAYCATNKKGINLLAAINKCFGGHVKKALSISLMACLDTASYYAYAAEEAMKGLGCDDLRLMRVLISRRDIDMDAIKGAFQAVYNEDFDARVKSELGGSLKRAALLSIGAAI